MAEDGVDRIVEQWARERPELDTEVMSLFGRIFRVSAAAGEAMERSYARYGITRADFDVLATLRRSGPPFQLSPGALSVSLMLTTGGMTGRLDRLERAGLVTRSPGSADRRSVLVSLTDSGRTLIDQAVTGGVDTQRELLADLPTGTRQQLNDLLRELLAAVTARAALPPHPGAPRQTVQSAPSGSPAPADPSGGRRA